MEQKFTLKKAFFYVAGSSLLLWGALFGFLFIQKKVLEKKAQDERFNIVAIYQKSKSTDRIPSIYLEELLELSQDKPTNMYAFSCRLAEKKLKSLPLFSYVKVGTAKPGVVFVEYDLRKPIFRIADFENLAMSEDRYLFPMSPFISPKNIPDLTLGKLEQKRVDFAFEVANYCSEHFTPSCKLKALDVSNAFVERAHRQIVLTIEEGVGENLRSYLLRLPLKNYQERLESFFKIKGALTNMEANMEKINPTTRFVVDLRLASIALVKLV